MTLLLRAPGSILTVITITLTAQVIFFSKIRLQCKINAFKTTNFVVKTSRHIHCNSFQDYKTSRHDRPQVRRHSANVKMHRLRDITSDKLIDRRQWAARSQRSQVCPNRHSLAM